MRKASLNLPRRIILSLRGMLAISVLAFFAAACRTKQNESVAAERAFGQAREAESRAAFLAAYKVFMHPRCMNCHPKGDAPLQGDDSHVHCRTFNAVPMARASLR